MFYIFQLAIVVFLVFGFLPAVRAQESGHGAAGVPEAEGEKRAETGTLKVNVPLCSAEEQLKQLIEEDKKTITAFEFFDKEFEDPKGHAFGPLFDGSATVFNAIYYRALMSIGKATSFRAQWKYDKAIADPHVFATSQAKKWGTGKFESISNLEDAIEDRRILGLALGVVGGIVKMMPSVASSLFGGRPNGQSIEHASLSLEQRKEIIGKIKTNIKDEITKRKDRVNNYESILKKNFSEGCPKPDAELTSWIAGRMALDARQADYYSLGAIKSSIEDTFAKGQSETNGALTVGVLAPTMYLIGKYRLPGFQVMQKNPKLSDQAIKASAAIGLAGLDTKLNLTGQERDIIKEFVKRAPLKLEEEKKEIERLEADLRAKEKVLAERLK